MAYTQIPKGVFEITIHIKSRKHIIITGIGKIPKALLLYQSLKEKSIYPPG